MQPGWMVLAIDLDGAGCEVKCQGFVEQVRRRALDGAGQFVDLANLGAVWDGGLLEVE